MSHDHPLCSSENAAWKHPHRITPFFNPSAPKHLLTNRKSFPDLLILPTSTHPTYEQDLITAVAFSVVAQLKCAPRHTTEPQCKSQADLSFFVPFAADFALSRRAGQHRNILLTVKQCECCPEIYKNFVEEKFQVFGPLSEN
jgi:hypothetical protein